MLAERELDWALLPHTTRKGTLRYLSAGETLCLDNAVLNSEERPHLVAAYKDRVCGLQRACVHRQGGLPGSVLGAEERHQFERLHLGSQGGPQIGCGAA